MDSIFGWLLMTAAIIGAGIWFAVYASAEYDRYIERRSCGWQ